MESKATNPYKKGTFNYLIWQEAYLAGRIDGQFEVMDAYFKKEIDKLNNKKIK